MALVMPTLTAAKSTRTQHNVCTADETGRGLSRAASAICLHVLLVLPWCDGTGIKGNLHKLPKSISLEMQGYCETVYIYILTQQLKQQLRRS